MKLIIVPDRRLHTVCQEIEEHEYGKDLFQKCHKLGTLLLMLRGLGLSACQVGWMQRVVVTRVDKKFIALCNPKITFRSGRKRVVERCLSIPERECEVYRPTRVTVTGTFPLDGEPFKVHATGYDAAIWCHEIGHLDGLLMTDLAKRSRSIEKLDMRGEAMPSAALA